MSISVKILKLGESAVTANNLPLGSTVQAAIESVGWTIPEGYSLTLNGQPCAGWTVLPDDPNSIICLVAKVEGGC